MERCNLPSVVCLGFFDGVHRGHQALLAAARKIADAEGLLLVAHTLDIAPGGKGKLLTSLDQRRALLLRYGADQVAVSVFDEAMRHLPGDVFFNDVVVSRLRARHVVCGEDHRFGYEGKWGVAELRGMCRRAGIGLTVVPPVTLAGGEKISSTLIRRALEAGNEALAREMLGHEV